MFTFNLGYRHGNGEVEGFTGTGFTSDAAKQHAERKLMAKLANIQQSFCRERIIDSREGLSSGELDTLKSDWVLSARSKTL